MFSSKSTTPIDRQLSKKVVKIIHSLLMMEQSAAFRKPVPHKALGLDDYKLIVKKPTDLNFIRRQNNDGKYKFVEQILDQIQLCWDNCKLYNAKGSQIYEQALYMQAAFDNYGKQILPSFWNDISRDQYNQKFDQKKIEEEKINKKLDGKNLPKKNVNVIETPSIYTFDQKSKNKRVSVSSQMYSDHESYETEKKVNKKQQYMVAEGEIIQNNNQILNQQKGSMDIQDGDQAPEITVQPIMVNLNQNPSQSQLSKISIHMKELYEQNELNLIQKILQILHTYEKQHMNLNKNGQMTFKMNKIHISTYIRILNVLGLTQQINTIIQ